MFIKNLKKKRNQQNPSSRKRYAHIKITRKLKWPRSRTSCPALIRASKIKCYFNYINIIYLVIRVFKAENDVKSAVHFAHEDWDAGANTAGVLFTKLCLSMGLESLALPINMGKMKQRRCGVLLVLC